MNGALQVLQDIVYHPHGSDRDEGAIYGRVQLNRNDAVAELRDHDGNQWEIVVRPA